MNISRVICWRIAAWMCFESLTFAHYDDLWSGGVDFSIAEAFLRFFANAKLNLNFEGRVMSCDYPFSSTGKPIVHQFNPYEDNGG